MVGVGGWAGGWVWVGVWVGTWLTAFMAVGGGLCVFVCFGLSATRALHGCRHSVSITSEPGSRKVGGGSVRLTGLV